MSGKVILNNDIKKKSDRDTVVGSVLNQRLMRETVSKKEGKGCC